MLLLYYLYNVIMQLARIPAGFLQIMRADLLAISPPAGVPGVGACFFAPVPAVFETIKPILSALRGFLRGFYIMVAYYTTPEKSGLKTPHSAPQQKVSIFCGQCQIFDIFNPENLGCVCRFWKSGKNFDRGPI